MSNTELEGVPALPPVESATLNEIEPPKWHWFYRKRARLGEYDKFGQQKEYPIFACMEVEAAELETQKNLSKFEQIGASDGTTYFNYMREHLKPNMVYNAQDAVKVEKEAFNAELEKARGHYRAPRRKDRYFGGASEGTAGVDEFKRTWS